jgi:hypothetical protein
LPDWKYYDLCTDLGEAPNWIIATHMTPNIFLSLFPSVPL